MAATQYCAPEREPAPAVTVASAVGSVTVVSGGEKKSPRRGDLLSENDGIVTGKASSLDLLIGGDTVIRVYENTNAKLSALLGEKNADGRFTLDKGSVFVIITRLRKGASFRVLTPTTTIAVRGTSFRATADRGGQVAVLTGKTEVRAVKDGVEKGSPAVVAKGNSAQVAADRSAVQVRGLAAPETDSLIAEFIAVKETVIDRLPEARKESFAPDAAVVLRERDMRLKEARDRALRESLEAKMKAELELQEKLRKEAEEKKKKEDEARARARREAQKQLPDRSGDVTGSK